MYLYILFIYLYIFIYYYLFIYIYYREAGDVYKQSARSSPVNHKPSCRSYSRLYSPQAIPWALNALYMLTITHNLLVLNYLAMGSIPCTHHTITSLNALNLLHTNTLSTVLLPCSVIFCTAYFYSIN